MAQSDSKDTNFQTVNAVTVSGAHLVHDIYSAFLAPILPLLIEKLSISYSLAGFLTVIQRLPSLLNPIVGLLADRISVRYFIIIAPSITAITMSLLGLAPNYFVLVALIFIMGISAAIFHVPAPVMMRRVSGDRVGMGMSFFMFAGELARSLGPLIILGAVSLWGLEGTYRLIPLGVACSIILFFRIRHIKISHEFSRQKSDANIQATIKTIWPTFKILFAILLTRSLIRGALTAFLPVYLSGKGVSIWVAGTALSAVQFSGAAGTMLSGTISDRFGRKTILLITAIASPLLMWLFMMTEGILLFPLLLIMGFFLVSPMPVMLAMVNEIKNDHPSFVNGIYIMINFIVYSIGAMSIGFLGDRIGLEMTYYISAGVALLTIPFVLMLKEIR